MGTQGPTTLECQQSYKNGVNFGAANTGCRVTGANQKIDCLCTLTPFLDAGPLEAASGTPSGVGDTHFPNAGSRTQDCFRDMGVPFPRRRQTRAPPPPARSAPPRANGCSSPHSPKSPRRRCPPAHGSDPPPTADGARTNGPSADLHRTETPGARSAIRSGRFQPNPWESESSGRKSWGAASPLSQPSSVGKAPGRL